MYKVYVWSVHIVCMYKRKGGVVKCRNYKQ